MRKLLKSFIRPYRRNLKVRITVLFTVLFSLIILLFAGSTYLFLEHEIIEEIDSLLLDDLKFAVNFLTIESDGKVGWRWKYISSPERIADHWIEVWDNFGEVGFRANPYGDRIILGFSGAPRLNDVSTAVRSRKGFVVFSRFSTKTNTSYRMMITRISIGKRSYTVRLVRSEKSVREELTELLVTFCIFAPLAVFFAAVSGYHLTNLMLKPFSVLATQAREISVENLSRRLKVRNPFDEFGQLASAFNNTFSRLERSFFQIERFSEEASHSLRTPLTCLLTVGELALSREGLDEESRDTIASMVEEARRLRAITNTLLTLARMDNIQGFGVCDDVDIMGLLEECVDEHMVLAEEKDQQLIICDSSHRPEVHMNRDMMKEALLAIIDNSIKYTQSGGRIDVSLRQDLREAIITISDNGPGVSDEHKESVFNRFNRGGIESREKTQGFGLGLALAKATIECYSGSIELKDNDDFEKSTMSQRDHAKLKSDSHGKQTMGRKGLVCIVRLPIV